MLWYSLDVTVVATGQIVSMAGPFPESAVDHREALLAERVNEHDADTHRVVRRYVTETPEYHPVTVNRETAYGRTAEHGFGIKVF